VESWRDYRKSEIVCQRVFRHSEATIIDNARTMQTVGQRIERAYEDAGYSQGEFAKLVGISQSTLSEIVTGETKLPSAKALLRMAEVLGKSERWIVYGEDGSLERPTPQEQDLLSAYRKLPPETQEHLAATIKSLVGSNQT